MKFAPRESEVLEGSFEEKKDEPRESGGVALSKKPEGQTGTLQRLAPSL
jgi:hypothetical protein